MSIKNNAEKVLQIINLEKWIPYPIEFVGSYALDLMVWNDIDLQILLPDFEESADLFTDVQKKLIPHLKKADFRIIREENNPRLPKGVYLGLNLNFPDLGGDWKIDLWAFHKKEFELSLLKRDLILSRLNPENRNEIMRLKKAKMSGLDRVPSRESYQIYKQVLNLL